MAKQTVRLDSLVDPDMVPTDTGRPQRGAEPRPELEPERSTLAPKRGRRRDPDPRTDQLSIRMRRSTRIKVEELAESEEMTIADLFEQMVATYKPSTK